MCTAMQVLDEKGDPQVPFPEPIERDDSWATRGEGTVNWLHRSTLPRAREARRFLNENLSALPLSGQAQAGFYRALETRWKSAFFELVVARVLQEMGADLEIEARLDVKRHDSASDRRPDFLAEFSDGVVVVEATSPVFNATVGEKIKRSAVLVEIIESLVPARWGVGIRELPAIGPNDCKRPFRQAVARLFSTLPPPEGSAGVELAEELTEGTLRLHLRPIAMGRRPLLHEPAVASWDDSEQRIRQAVDAKRAQVRGSVHPVLLAIEGSGFESDLEGFDFALFGRTYEQLDHRHRSVGTGFDPSGEFCKPGKGDPTLAGVLAFPIVGFLAVETPVLYMHPRFRGRVPEAIQRLPQCHYDAEAGQIRRVAGQVGEIGRALRLVPPDV